jgi:hypothetical protein
MFKRGKGGVPKRTRSQPSRFESTKEWKQLKAAIDSELTPGEFVAVILTEEQKKEIGIAHRRTIARFIKKYVRARTLPYSIKSFTQDGMDHYYVTHDVPVTKRKQA